MTNSRAYLYTLNSAPVLGFDLVRLPGGAGVAGVLLRMMSATTDELLLASSAAAGGRSDAKAWADVAKAEGSRRELRARAEAAAARCRDREDPKAGDLVVVECSPLGTLEGLLECFQHDVLGELSEIDRLEDVIRVASDALAGYYMKELLPTSSLRSLTEPWLQASAAIPSRLHDFGPGSGDIQRLFDCIVRMQPPYFVRFAARYETAPMDLSDWAPAVHSASLAVFLSKRTRPMAAAQLRLVEAIDAAEASFDSRAGGLWNALSGAVHAMIVTDMLDDRTYEMLVKPARELMG